MISDSRGRLSLPIVLELVRRCKRTVAAEPTPEAEEWVCIHAPLDKGKTEEYNTHKNAYSQSYDKEISYVYTQTH